MRLLNGQLQVEQAKGQEAATQLAGTRAQLGQAKEELRGHLRQVAALPGLRSEVQKAQAALQQLRGEHGALQVRARERWHAWAAGTAGRCQCWQWDMFVADWAAVGVAAAASAS